MTGTCRKSSDKFKYMNNRTKNLENINLKRDRQKNDLKYINKTPTPTNTLHSYVATIKNFPKSWRYSFEVILASINVRK